MGLLYLYLSGFFQKAYMKNEMKTIDEDPLGKSTDFSQEHQKFSKEKEAVTPLAPFLVNSTNSVLLPLFLPTFHPIFLLPPCVSPHYL